MIAPKTALNRLAIAALTISLAPAAEATDQGKEAAMTEIRVIFGEKTLTATLDTTPVTQDFAALLPLDLTLSDYHGIEKVADMPRKLDTSGVPDSYEPKAGDITLYAPWGNLAIFYKPFQRSRGHVRLGAFDGPIDMLVRNGDFPVRIEVAD
ncbi:cyclophilin-like fold protein [Roseovarius atlanticus]|uniref:cyclophilin-like fold protein n=1 Tax=Roseovarius atlanticus TaxID=1641875 RepID=UPI000A55996C|nr:cyclophilin-like fold protein [Roseovarius atlanticus]